MMELRTHLVFERTEDLFKIQRLYREKYPQHLGRVVFLSIGDFIKSPFPIDPIFYMNSDGCPETLSFSGYGYRVFIYEYPTDKQLGFPDSIPLELVDQDTFQQYVIKKDDEHTPGLIPVFPEEESVCSKPEIPEFVKEIRDTVWSRLCIVQGPGGRNAIIHGYSSITEEMARFNNQSVTDFVMTLMDTNECNRIDRDCITHMDGFILYLFVRKP